MQDYERNWVRLPLEKAYNVREIGGYPLKDGGQTAYHRFLRADDISQLSDNDVNFLLNYGVNFVLDLRSEWEATRMPDKLIEQPCVGYARVALFGRDLSRTSQNSSKDVKKGLDGFYLSMVKNKQAIIEIFEEIANAPEGCILFHCYAGKDRTGVLAMLLMSLAGVGRGDCLTNYIQSYLNLSQKPDYIDNSVERMPEELKEEAKLMMKSQPEALIPVYDYVMDNYGSTEAYLLECGLTSEQITKVKKRIIAED